MEALPDEETEKKSDYKELLMALRDKIPSILQHIRAYEPTLEYNYRLYASYEGQIKREIEDSMRKEILSPQALSRALQRIPSINILRKGIDKISTVYAEPVKRINDNETDSDIIAKIVAHSSLDVEMLYADAMANLQKMSAIEPYVEDGVMKFRVYGGHQFLPYSDDPINPLKMTVFIKLLGTMQKEVVIEDSINAQTGLNQKQASTVIKEVNMYLLYSDDEVLLVDSTGDVLTERQAELNISPKNTLGIIPQKYINKSHFELVPFPDTSGLDTAVLIPKLLTDLNYAVQFQSHSILWVKNVELGNQEINPDTIVDLGTSEEGGKDGEIGTLDPKVDIEGVLAMVEFELNGYFSSIGIKTGSMNGLKSGREVSGIAKAIDEGDVTLVRRKNIEFFKKQEKDLWSKIAVIQNTWVKEGRLRKENRTFSKDMTDTMKVIFGETKVMESVQDKVVKLQAQDQLGVITRKDIIKEFNPDFSDAQINKRLESVKAEQKEKMDLMLEEMDATAAINNNNNIDEVQPGAEKSTSVNDDNKNNRKDS